MSTNTRAHGISKRLGNILSHLSKPGFLIKNDRQFHVINLIENQRDEQMGYIFLRLNSPNFALDAQCEYLDTFEEIEYGLLLLYEGYWNSDHDNSQHWFTMISRPISSWSSGHLKGASYSYYFMNTHCSNSIEGRRWNKQNYLGMGVTSSTIAFQDKEALHISLSFFSPKRLRWHFLDECKVP